MYLRPIKTNETYQLLFDGSNVDYSNNPTQNLSQIDWNVFNEKAMESHLAPLLHKNLSGVSGYNQIPENTRAHLKNAYNQVLARNVILQQVFVDFVSLLNKEQIPVIPLKGIYLGEVVYKDIGARHLSDIDVLIQEKDLTHVCDLMRNRGWSVKSMTMHSKIAEEEFTHAHPATLVKSHVSIELHTHLYNRNQGTSISKKELWGDTYSEQFLGVEIRQLSSELLLQHLCLHLHKHLVGHELKILNFCDIREFLVVQKDNFSWQRFKNLAEQYSCKEEIDQILYLCVKYWNVSIPKDFLNSEMQDTKLNERFWNFMSGDSKKEKQFLKNRLSIKNRNISQLKSNKDRLTFLQGFVFPTSDFMRKRYNLTADGRLFPWYVYRPIELSIKTFKALFTTD
ncbi:nucleotidyltransferase family protein [Bacteroidota bacterium]